MKHLIALLLALAGYAHAAAPSASLVASRTSGTAPLCVHFDATGSTDADTTNPFRDLLYRWNFGNQNAGNWTRGANTSRSKNMARGPVAGHCYESAGSYTAQLQVCDATTCATATQAITVTAADTTFSGTNTTCFYNSTVGTGCPIGATQTASSDFDAAIGTCLASGKRCLFKRGDTFAASASSALSGTVTGAEVGAYGSGAKPIVTVSGINVFVFTGTVSDVRFIDLEIVGAGSASGTGTFLYLDAATTNITALRVDCRAHGACFSVLGVGTTNRATGLFVQDSTMTAYTGGNATYMAIKSGAFMGNLVDDARGSGYSGCPACDAEHGLRFQYAQKAVISHNSLGKAWTGKHQLTVRGAPRGAQGASENDDLDSNRVYISDNYFDSTTLGLINVTIAPSADSQCHWVRDVIFERNYIKTPAISGALGVYVNASRVTLRNNVLEQLTTGEGLVSVSNGQDNTCSADPVVNTANALPPPTGNWIGNNTIYRTGGKPDFTPIALRGNFTTAVLDSTAYNNLAYAPSTTATTAVAKFGTTDGTTDGNNSTDTQARTVNPFVTTPVSAITFRPTAGSYATTGGTSLFPSTAEDFFLCRDRNGSARIGALVPASRAQCSGVAQ